MGAEGGPGKTEPGCRRGLHVSPSSVRSYRVNAGVRLRKRLSGAISVLAPEGVPAAEAGQARPPPPSSRVGRGRHGLSFLPPPSTSSTDHVPWSPSKGWVLSFIQRDAKAFRPLAATAGWIIGSGQNGRPQPNRPLRPSSKGTSPLPGLGPDAVQCSGRDSFLPQAGLVPDAPLSGRGLLSARPPRPTPAWLTWVPDVAMASSPRPRLAFWSLTAHTNCQSLWTLRSVYGSERHMVFASVPPALWSLPPAVWSSRELADRTHRQPPILGSSAAIVRLFGLRCPQAVFPEGPSGAERSVCFFPAFMSTDTISARWSSPACPSPCSLFRPLPETSFPGRLPTESRECTGAAHLVHLTQPKRP